MIDEIMEEAKQSMEKAMESLANELKKIRTGRAHTSMMDSVVVNYYGNPSPLNQVASITCPDAKSFLIAPWETNILKDIEAAIIKSNLGLAPMNDGKVIRLKLPEVTEERRKDLVKQTKKVAEDARVSVRMARREANELIKNSQKQKEITEDDQKKFLLTTQEVTDEYVKKIDQIASEKEKAVMTV